MTNKFFKDIEAEFAHVEGDINTKVSAWLSEVESKLSLFRSHAAKTLPNRAAAALESAAAGLRAGSVDIAKHDSLIDGSGPRT